MVRAAGSPLPRAVLMKLHRMTGKPADIVAGDGLPGVTNTPWGYDAQGPYCGMETGMSAALI